uniref:Uncharacterized protein n=1 Tax=Arundo donax TaxID=35708 RepID=A0A0A9D2H9_ARUDO
MTPCEKMCWNACAQTLREIGSNLIGKQSMTGRVCEISRFQCLGTS